MTVASVMIELAPQTDANAAISEVTQTLTAAPEVERAVVDEDTDRFDVASAVAMLAAAVVLVDQGTKLLESVTKLVKTMRTLVQESQSLKSAVIEVSGIKIDANADEAQIKEAVAQIMDE